jgi:hypothetical protein
MFDIKLFVIPSRSCYHPLPFLFMCGTAFRTFAVQFGDTVKCIQITLPAPPVILRLSCLARPINLANLQRVQLI